MRRATQKRAAAIRVYLKRRKQFLIDRPWCARCGGTSQQVHHMAGRMGAALLDETRWLPLCEDCHQHVTEHPAEALARGWSLSRIGRVS